MFKHITGLSFFLITSISGLGISVSASATPVFIKNVGIQANGGVKGDLKWQNHVGEHYIQDFDDLPQNPYEKIYDFTIGDITVTPYLSNESTAGMRIENDSFYDIKPGVMYENVLLNCFSDTYYKCSSSVTYKFSEAVYGFGLWIFDDDYRYPDSFQMTVNGRQSSVLDSAVGVYGYGSSRVEGFLGVADEEGIWEVTVSNLGRGRFFEMDYLQIAPLSNIASVPEPGSLLMVLLGLLGLSGRRITGITG